jgi:hypothetical protein
MIIIIITGFFMSHVELCPSIVLQIAYQLLSLHKNFILFSLSWYKYTIPQWFLYIMYYVTKIKKFHPAFSKHGHFATQSQLTTLWIVCVYTCYSPYIILKWHFEVTISEALTNVFSTSTCNQKVLGKTPIRLLFGVNMWHKRVLS